MSKNINFSLQQRENHIFWRKTNILTNEWGYQNGAQYEHIIPKKIWTENLWRGIRNTLPAYLKNEKCSSAYRCT